MSKPLVKGFIESFQVKDVDMGSRTLVQAYTRYNVKDSDGDIGRKGMFDKTWAENAGRIKHLFNHKDTVGVIQTLWDDNDYAYFRSKIGTHDLGEDFMKMADSGIITEASYGFNIIKQRKTAEGNELLEVKLWETSSLDKWGANQHTPVISFQKSMGNEAYVIGLLERKALLERFCYTSNATDRTLQQLEQEKKEIDQQLLDILAVSTQAVPDADSEGSQATLEPQEEDYSKEAAFLFHAASHTFNITPQFKN